MVEFPPKEENSISDDVGHSSTLWHQRLGHFLQGYSNADLGGCSDTRKSTTGFVFTVGGTTVSSFALSTTEVKYMAISKAGKEMIWLKNFLEELGKKQCDNALCSDNHIAIHLAKNLVFHAKTKHIYVRYNFIRELISDCTLLLKKIPRSENPADMLTKVVTTEKLKFCIVSTGLHG
uniref:Retrovirus-related Pol polyprotein from transposon TNT 1-94 n=1 Tax=Cajanus cajan TaxID=3821 RepID=A0A151QR59_CAJCA|nr:Retrovirus-related Pol polyprotein from transposon TNT 1-94 [Cajanus cajan]